MIGKLRLWTVVVTVMVAIDALIQPLIMLLIATSGAFRLYIATHPGSVDKTALVFKIATIVMFVRWIYVAGDNLLTADVDGLAFTPASRIWWFFIPVASLVMPFRAMRELWNASRSNRPYNTNNMVVSSWWLLWLSNTFLYFLEGFSTLAIILNAGLGLMLAVAAIAMIHGIAKGQGQLEQHDLGQVFV